LLEIAEGFAQLGGGGAFGTGQIAGGILHLFFEALQFLELALPFGGQLLVELTVLGAALNGGLVAVGFADALGEILLLVGEILSALDNFGHAVAGFLAAHAVERVAGFLEALGGAARLGAGALALGGVRSSAPHVFGCLAQLFERALEARVHALA
jgi:hypothetical protein